MVGDALASGNSVYESEEDIELVGQALPFGLKLTETLLGESPRHPGLLITACRGYVLYSYAFVDYPAELAEEEDLDRARALRSRGQKVLPARPQLLHARAGAMVSGPGERHDDRSSRRGQ